MYARLGFILIAVSLTGVLAFGGFVHAVVHHEHGEKHEGAPTALWTDLHAILGSAQRKMFFAVIGAAFLFSLFSLARYAEKVFLLALRREREHIRSLDPIYGELLRRGVMPHRAFR